ncbi:Alpha/Beta hydrolase protein [Phlyctochytrium arcticum]|nr:Alpha/Beta hydrolase protein [Phlyctochytrium arcticum]
MSIACGMAALPTSIGTGDDSSSSSSSCSSTTQCRNSPLIVTTAAFPAHHQLLQVASPPPTSLISASSNALRNLAWPVCLPFRAASLAYTAASEVVYLADLSRHNVGNTLSAVRNFYCRPEKTRPSWNLPFHLLLKAIKSNLEYPNHTLGKIRGSANLLVEVTMPRNVRITPFKFHINRSILLETERRATEYKIRKAEDRARQPNVCVHHSSDCTASSSTCCSEPSSSEELDDIEWLVPEECSGTDQYELTGEWVEWVESGAQKTKQPKVEPRVILYIHGGAFLCGSPKSHRSLVWRIAKETGARVFVLDYRLAPEHAFPAAIHDAYAAYLYLTNPTHPAFLKPGVFFSPNLPAHQPIPAQSIIVMGDSAGGGLSAGLMVYLKDFLVDKTGEPVHDMVRGGVLLSPWVELTCSTDSWDSNYATDYLPGKPSTVFYSMFRETVTQGGPPVNPVYSYLFGEGDQGRERQFSVSAAPVGKSLTPAKCSLSGCTSCPTTPTPFLKIPTVDMSRRDSGVLLDDDGSTSFDDTASSTSSSAIETEAAHLASYISPPPKPQRQLDPEEIVFRIAKHPLASPIYAKCAGMPPILIQSGDSEMLRDESLLFAHRLAVANPEVHTRGLHRQELYTDMPHVFQAFTFLESSVTSILNISHFISRLYNSELPVSTLGLEKGLYVVDPSFPPTETGETTVPHMDVMEGLQSALAGVKVVSAAAAAGVWEDLERKESWMLGEGIHHPFL